MPKSTAMTYEIKLATENTINLIEMDIVLDSLSSAIPKVSTLVGMTSMAGTWVGIKYPTPHHSLSKASPGIDGVFYLNVDLMGHRVIQRLVCWHTLCSRLRIQIFFRH